MKETQGETSVRIINSIGQVVERKTFTATDEINMEIEGASGLYIVEIETKGEILGRVQVAKK